MLENSQDLLNITLTLGFALIVIFLVIALFYLIFILRDLAAITQLVRSTSKKVSAVVIEPLKILTQIFAKTKVGLKVLEKFLEQSPKRPRKH